MLEETSQDPQSTQDPKAGGSMSATDAVIDGHEDAIEHTETDLQVADGEDLRNDLQNILEGDFDFKGSYAYGSLLPDAPNPCLHIGGLGVLGLPLSERDAKHIIECAEKASNGHGDQTIMDQHARDDWEIAPDQVAFGNSAWKTFLAGVVQLICEKLGVHPSSSPPRCELYKLLLYGPKSHILPHQDTEKVDGMFATIVVNLPSSYTGGQVQVSHDNMTEIFDFAPNSFTTAHVVASYAEVVHEMKPITSGYRLALAYNLIHASPGIQRPRLPNIEVAKAKLREVLCKWAESKYPDHLHIKIIAYLLKHKYSKEELAKGAIQDEDAHKISHLRSIAEELGYVVGLANLSYNESGVADDSDNGIWEDNDDDNSDGDHEDIPSMLEVTDTNLSIDNLVDLNGVPISDYMNGYMELSLEEENLIPDDPFEGVSPDETEYESDEPGGLEYWYYRTVLVFFHKENKLDLFLSAGGVAFALRKITNNPSQSKNEENYKLVDYILQRAVVGLPTDSHALRSVADYALQWNDLEIWKRAVEKSGVGKAIDVFGIDKLLEACRTFSFEPVRTIFESILASRSDFRAQVRLLESLRAKSSCDDISLWCNDQISVALTSLKTPTISDVQLLTSLVISKGLPIVEDKILPQLANAPSSFAFWTAFISALHKKKGDLIKVARSTPEVEETHSEAECQDSEAEAAPDRDDNDLFDDVMEQCFNAAIRQWDMVPPAPNPPPHAPTAKTSQPREPVISRILELMGLCITTGNLTACTRLILVIVRTKGEPVSTFRTLYRPLIPQLRGLLVKHRVNIYSRPFGDFMRILIGMYLSTVLGTKPNESRVNIRKIGCGCDDCENLDTFIVSQDTERRFLLPQLRRTHLEKQALRATDLVRFRTLYSTKLQVLVMTKKREVAAMIQWQIRSGKAKKFLSLIGKGDTIAKIMGSRYADVEKAVDGIQPYAMKAPAAASADQQTIRDANTTQITDLPMPSGSTQTPSVPETPHRPQPPTAAMPNLRRKRDDETTQATVLSKHIAMMKKPIISSYKTIPGSKGSSSVITYKKTVFPDTPSATEPRILTKSSSQPSGPVSAPVDRASTKEKAKSAEKPRVMATRSSPRKAAALALSHKGEDKGKQRSATQVASTSLRTATVALQAKGMVSSPRVKAEPVESPLRPQKRRKTGHVFLGPVIEISDDDD